MFHEFRIIVKHYDETINNYSFEHPNLRNIVPTKFSINITTKRVPGRLTCS
jgi:hypothetical protein